MHPIFRAGRALGRAEVLRLIRDKDGSASVREASSCLNSTGIPALREVAQSLNVIASNWRSNKDQLPGITSRIQAVGPKEYQAVSAGLWMGIAIESCIQAVAKDAVKDIETADYKAGIADVLEKARAHVEALRLQEILPTMPDFNGQFRAEISGVSAVRQTGQLQGHIQLIQRLSDQVGNAIK